ncbi:acyl-CoA dehydrogenase family protein [Kocuria arenosa]|uniref:acyl-CoA dehydrogenase family protein n=1 Tax=Kocuria arenosa TaxID=3071446 RepID=UPI0034D6FC8D
MSLPTLTPGLESPTAPLAAPTTAREALEAARACASRIEGGSVSRDAHRTHPLDQLQELAGTGLLAVRLPATHAGPELPRSVAGDVLRVLARGDSAVGQLVLSHFVLLDIIGDAPSEELRELLYGAVAAGGWLGNATAERGTAHVFDRKTTITEEPEGTFRVRGHKFYTTGALGSAWIGVSGNLDGDPLNPAIAFVRPDDPGVTIDTDWSAFGQRSTASGSIQFDDVTVPALQVLRLGPLPADPPRSPIGAYDQLLHAAIDTGIARAAMEDGAAFVRDHARPWVESGVARVSEEPHVILRFGQLQTQLYALEALFARAGAALDRARTADPTDDHLLIEASLAVAETKAFAQDVGPRIATDVIELAGTSATDERHGFDRHWRNVRTHTLHDPARWKYVHIGNHLLNDVPPPKHPLI